MGPSQLKNDPTKFNSPTADAVLWVDGKLIIGQMNSITYVSTVLNFYTGTTGRQTVYIAPKNAQMDSVLFERFKDCRLSKWTC